MPHTIALFSLAHFVRVSLERSSEVCSCVLNRLFMANGTKRRKETRFPRFGTLQTKKYCGNYESHKIGFTLKLSIQWKVSFKFSMEFKMEAIFLNKTWILLPYEQLKVWNKSIVVAESCHNRCFICQASDVQVKSSVIKLEQMFTVKIFKKICLKPKTHLPLIQLWLTRSRSLFQSTFVT